jgi:3',5'-cyclic AMP phosphodiesterase CpdA
MAFTLAHISDPHLSPLPMLAPRDYFSKRLLGYLNWKRKRQYIHNPKILARLIEDMRIQHLDHIAVTGDLTNLGLEKEYEAARDWLKDLAPPGQLSVVPGNHDAYVPGALEHGLPYLSEWINLPFPQLQMRGDIALVGISTAIPTLPFQATGRAGREQLKQLAKILGELKREGKFRIVLMHHALRVPWRQPSKRLLDRHELQAVLESEGAELVLHGHLHRATHHTSGKAHVFGVPSASADPAICDTPAGYALYRIDKTAGGWSVSVTRRSIGKDLQFKDMEELQLRF